jgi:hypothetical protein
LTFNPITATAAEPGGGGTKCSRAGNSSRADEHLSRRVAPPLRPGGNATGLSLQATDTVVEDNVGTLLRSFI